MTQKEIEDMLKSHESRLNNIDIAYTEIKTKLNIIIGFLAVIGTAFAGVIVKMMF